MLLHLEPGACQAEIDEGDIVDLALECYQSSRYTSDNPGYNFQCPICETPFEKVSGLLQHIKSDACEESLAIGSPLWKFLRFLRSRL